MTYKPKDEQERILHRLKIVRGHLNKVIEMAENHNYCIDVVHQSNAIQKALREIDNVIIENHLRTCIVEKINSGETQEVIREIMDVMKRK